MKKSYHIINPVVLAAALIAAPVASAQEAATTEAGDSLSGKVHLAFRTVDNEADILGGVSTVNMVDLEKKSYTDYSLSNMQSLVNGYNGDLWGQGSALVLVDGVPRDANNILPQEIESISFLKGAQAVVLYGSKAAKGVILISTKRGNVDGLRVNVRGDVSLNVPKRYQQYLSSPEYMTLYNEARHNDGLNDAFSDLDIYNYASGSNPFRYPDINYFSSEYLKKNWMKYEGQAEFIGGGKFAKFYAMVGLYHTDDLLNFGEGKKNGTTRLSVRGNIDLNLNEWVTGWVNTSVTFYDNRYDHSGYWNAAATMTPTQSGTSPLVPLIPISAIEANDENSWILANNSRYLINGQYLIGGTQNYQTNPFASMYAGGYTKATTRQLQFDAGVRVDMGRITPGLSFTAQGAVDYHTYYATSIDPQYAVYEAHWTHYGGKDVIDYLTKYGDDLNSGTQNVSSSAERQTLMFAGHFDYKRTFEGVHNVEGNLVGQAYKRSYTGRYHHNASANLGLRAAYNYDSRYYAEFNGSVNYSAKFAPGHRAGFSPVGSIGWRLKNEEFLKDNDVISELRLNATYGMLLQDIDMVVGTTDEDEDKSFYMWDSKYTADGNWWGWNDSHGSNQAFQSRQGANPDLTFIKRKEFNVGLTAGFLNNELTVNGNFFNIVTDGLPVKSTDFFPNYMSTYYPESSFIPWINYNKRRHTGFDLGVQYNKKFGEFELGIGANVMYVDSKNLKISENVEFDWLRSEGAKVDALRGYRCLGFFQTDDEIANSAVINNNTKRGDLKYEDMNKDGVIDYRDQVTLGRWGNPWSYGLNLTGKYKGFTLFVAATAGTGGNFIMNNSNVWVYGGRKYTPIVRDRWTPETAETATYPRLTTQGGELNFVTSDFWMRSSDYFSLDQIQLTYDFPAKMFAGKFVKGLQLYVNGNSLLRVCHEREYQETSIGYAPQCRAYNFGVKVNF
ncbi:MAG: SusC/RagA family TonB-linked outer membrane protein [Muribaculaceae bacterium]|nr:SusC/RagA family TonB-linked outer membrane protein [Muribaculaceae bacterium]